MSLLHAIDNDSAADRHAGANDRRSPSRLSAIRSWRKSIAPVDNVNKAIPARSVDIWITRTLSVLSSTSALSLLTAEDWNLSRRVTAPAAKDSAIASRVLLRIALSSAVMRRVEPRDWLFAKTPYGKPIVCNSVVAPPGFSVSHVDDFAVVAVGSGVNLGVDMEFIDHHIDEPMMSAFSHIHERNELARVAKKHRARRFLSQWTQKEAYTKLLGCGHSMEFSSIDCHSFITPAGSAPLRLENFFVSSSDCIYHASIAFQCADHVDAPIKIQLVTVNGHAESTSISPALNIP